MSSFENGQLTYLVVLCAAVLFWFVTNHRQSFGKILQQAMAWVLIFLGVIVAIGMWGDIRDTVRPTQAVFSDEGRIEIPRSQDGHYRLTLTINGKPILFVVDTGASQVVLSKADAAKAGLDLENLVYYGRALTANGEVRTAPVTLTEVKIGTLTDRNVAAQVNGGELDQSLLGMSYLQRFEQITITGQKLILTR
ncbi:TIGR02281 family clan AA aspartic protease [Shimia litoralis]|uniref:TIGR02281 family clan AA aspartic protease n=1 Tax=Shimia litoralis TaxID=420403 RepID=A0A4U7N584_9RHOB|nr:TIGR02281 family clan AA aspartic protease [Shimia litoralis]TKZ20733.1 TIGR02281 family clan AA aspartic protease [Shimia litoralis]